MGTSCQKSSVYPAPQRKPMSSSTLQIASNGAATFNSQQDINLGDPGFVQISACNADVLQITSGIYHIVSHQTIDKNGITIDQRSNAQNMKMIDATTGAIFNGSSTGKIADHFSFTDGKLMITESESVMLTTPGSNNNSEVKFDLHEIFDSQGNMTVSVDNFRFGCK
jgi:hypothetical protein